MTHPGEDTKTDLSDWSGQKRDNLFMWNCHHALVVDLNDAVTHTDPSSLCNTATQQTADLKGKSHKLCD